MATLNGLFNDIADAIREKTGTAQSIQASNFPTAINNITISEPAIISVYNDDHNYACCHKSSQINPPYDGYKIRTTGGINTTQDCEWFFYLNNVFILIKKITSYSVQLSYMNANASQWYSITLSNIGIYGLKYISMAYGNGTYVIAFNDNNQGCLDLRYSTNLGDGTSSGATFTQSYLLDDNSSNYVGNPNIIFAQNKFWIEPGKRSLSSSDGITWTSTYDANKQCYLLAYDSTNDTFYRAPGRVSENFDKSSDGSTWTTITSSNNVTTFAVQNGRYIRFYISGTHRGGSYNSGSTCGIYETYSTQPSISTLDEYNIDLALCTNNHFVIKGCSGIRYSSNGTTWSYLINDWFDFSAKTLIATDNDILYVCCGNYILEYNDEMLLKGYFYPKISTLPKNSSEHQINKLYNANPNQPTMLIGDMNAANALCDLVTGRITSTQELMLQCAGPMAKMLSQDRFKNLMLSVDNGVTWTTIRNNGVGEGPEPLYAIDPNFWVYIPTDSTTGQIYKYIINSESSYSSVEETTPATVYGPDVKIYYNSNRTQASMILGGKNMSQLFYYDNGTWKNDWDTEYWGPVYDICDGENNGTVLIGNNNIAFCAYNSKSWTTYSLSAFNETDWTNAHIYYDSEYEYYFILNKNYWYYGMTLSNFSRVQAPVYEGFILHKSTDLDYKYIVNAYPPYEIYKVGLTTFSADIKDNNTIYYKNEV